MRYAAGVRFCYLKASQGITIPSKVYHSRAEAARAVGIHVGPYHFADPGLDSHRQVELMLRVAGKWAPGDLPPALDLESSPASMTGSAIEAWALRWLADAQMMCGRKPILYHGPRFWRERGHVPQLLAGAKLDVWRAEYHNEHAPSFPGPASHPASWNLWPGYRIWQYSGNGRLPFYKGALDLNAFTGTEAELDAWCK